MNTEFLYIDDADLGNPGLVDIEIKIVDKDTGNVQHLSNQTIRNSRSNNHLIILKGIDNSKFNTNKCMVQISIHQKAFLRPCVFIRDEYRGTKYRGPRGETGGSGLKGQMPTPAPENVEIDKWYDISNKIEELTYKIERLEGRIITTSFELSNKNLDEQNVADKDVTIYFTICAIVPIGLNENDQSWTIQVINKNGSIAWSEEGHVLANNTNTVQFIALGKNHPQNRLKNAIFLRIVGEQTGEQVEVDYRIIRWFGPDIYGPSEYRGPRGESGCRGIPGILGDVKIGTGEVSNDQIQNLEQSIDDIKERTKMLGECQNALIKPNITPAPIILFIPVENVVGIYKIDVSIKNEELDEVVWCEKSIYGHFNQQGGFIPIGVTRRKASLCYQNENNLNIEVKIIDLDRIILSKLYTLDVRGKIGLQGGRGERGEAVAPYGPNGFEELRKIIENDLKPRVLNLEAACLEGE